MQGQHTFLPFKATWVMLVLAALSLPMLASGQVHYRVTGLGFFSTDTTGRGVSNANAINNAGDVVGDAGLVSGNQSLGGAPFLYHNGALIQLGNFGTDSTGASGGGAFGINDAGDIVGESDVYDANHVPGGRAPFLYHNGMMTRLGNFGTDSNGLEHGHAGAINDAGDIVGYSAVYDSAHNSLGNAAFYYHNGTMTNLGNFGTDTSGVAINDAGDILGVSITYDLAHNSLGATSFLYHSTTNKMTQLSNYGAQAFEASAINASGTIAGSIGMGGNLPNYLVASTVQNGTLTSLGSLGTDDFGRSNSVAYALNSEGDVVGYSIATHDEHAFLYKNGQMLDLNALIPADSGWTLNFATGINDKGQICGIGTHNDNREAFVLDPLPAGDFNGDGHADLLWQNPADGHTYAWLMNNLAYVGGLGTSLFAPTPDWQVVATPDLNGDGKPDFLWQNSKTGDVAYWLLDGGTVLTGNLLASGIGTDWRIIGTADLNHDGKPDLVWWNARSASAAVWYMNGMTFQSSVLLASNVTGWTLTGVMPHLADNKVSLLWRNNTNGDLGYWSLDNTTVQSGGLISTGVPQDWQVAGVSDLNGDGQPDILWQNRTSGDAVVWYMKGATYKSGSAIAGTSGAKWKLIGAR